MLTYKAGLQLLTTCIALLSRTEAFRNLAVFGDSLSDDCTHGASRLVDDLLDTDQSYPGAPYYKGCVFSNGPVYTDIAAEILDLPLENYAVGGATSGATQGELYIPPGFANLTTEAIIKVPSTLEQAENYVNIHNGTSSNDTLYIIFIGGNDYLGLSSGQGTADVQSVLMYTVAAMDLLYQAGARTFFTQTLPSIAQTPAVRSAGHQAMALAELLVEEHNRGLNTAMTHFTHQNPDASVILFDLHNLEQAIHENASSYNITNLSEPCYAWQDSQKLLILNGAIPSVCSNPSSYAFWDALHPTRVIHQLWGEALAKQLQQLSVLFGVRMNGSKSDVYPEPLRHLERPNLLKLYGTSL